MNSRWLSLFAARLLASAAIAQSITGSITGIVTDSTGAVVPGRLRQRGQQVRRDALLREPCAGAHDGHDDRWRIRRAPDGERLKRHFRVPVFNWDTSLCEEMVITDGGMRIQLRAEALNAFSTPRFGSPNTSVTSSSLGTITFRANAPRPLQFGLRFVF